MEGYFSIAQIASKVKRSKQAIYKLISNNQELGKILPDNTIAVGKGKQYSKVVLDWITNYYEQINESEGENQEQEEQTSVDQVEMALLRQQVEHLKEKLAMAEKQLEEVQAEKRDMRQENGALLLLLAQEKQEKQQLLIEAQEQKAIAIQEAQVEEAEEEKPQEGKEQSGFFARLFSRRKKGSAEK